MWSYEQLALDKSVEDVALALEALPRFMWLDSAADAANKTNRYSIFVAFPYFELVAEGSIVYCIKDGSRELFKGSLFQALEELMPEPLDLREHSIPFQGGALGYISYEFAKNFIEVKGTLPSINDTPLAQLAFYDFALIFDKTLKEYWLFSRNEQAQTPSAIVEFKKVLISHRKRSPFKMKGAFKPLMSKQEYALAFSDIERALLLGEAYQVNFTQPFVNGYSGSPLSAYLKLRTANQCPFSAYLDLGNIKVLSLSPERFFKVDSVREIEVRPIKGTMPRGKSPAIDEVFAKGLLASEKNQQENVMIVDLMRNDLSKICKPFSLKVEALFGILTLPAVHHLESVICGELQDEITVSNILNALFPCGSITGAPKVSAMKVIDSVECVRREVYCGAIGYFSADGQCDLNVAIRTMVAKDKQLSVFAGGGIVIDSTMEGEYQETFAKLSKILKVLCY